MPNFNKYLKLFEVARKQFDKFSSEASKEELDSIALEFNNLQQKGKIPNEFNIQAKTTTLNSLKDLISKQKEIKTNKEVKKEIKGDAEKVFDNKNVTIVIPKTFEASCLYGSNTKWCTTWKGAPEHFDSFKKFYNIHYILPKNNIGKIAVLIDSNGEIPIVTSPEGEGPGIFDSKDNMETKSWLKSRLIELGTSYDKIPWKKKTLSIKECIKGTYTFHDGVYDVDGDVYLKGRDLTKIPFKFGKVTGNFYCTDNQLTSLEYCPESVGGDFYCYNNPLPNNADTYEKYKALKKKGKTFESFLNNFYD